MRYLVETASLCKHYAGRAVVQQLSLAVPEGSVYGFIGPNGAGKSTTMKMLLGLLRPSSGSIQILGRPMDDKNRLTLLRQTGSLIESPSCYGHLTGQENLEIVADLKGVPRGDIGRVLEIVGLASSKKKRVKQYSLGMRQRLGIAQALLGSPKLLFLDEPTNGLDPAGIQEMRKLISEMPKRCGATVLISSHLLNELEQIVDRVGIIHQGQLLFQGPLTKLRQHSRGDIFLRVLHPQNALPVFQARGVAAKQDDREQQAFTLPAMTEESLALLVQQLSASQSGIVELNRRTKSLEEIFLSLTGRELE